MAFLGNIQKDGTYSVITTHGRRRGHARRTDCGGPGRQEIRPIPRLPAASGLTCLVPGLSSYPLIWRSDRYGFESGYAYGKSLRTVKAASQHLVPYGVDDSVGLAVELENRYKGLRAPPRSSLAYLVAPANALRHGQDVGIIATERGWNLYVCGNGGETAPRRTDCLGPDKDQLISLIDRFLMF